MNSKLKPKPKDHYVKSPEWVEDTGEGQDFTPNGQDLFAFNLGDGCRRWLPPRHD